MFDVMLPKSLDSEQTVLGAILINRMQDELVISAFESLVAGDFFEPKNQAVFEGIKQLVTEDKPVEAPSLADIIPKYTRYIAELMANAPGWGTIDFYAKIVKEKSIERRMIKACQDSIIALSSGMAHAEKLNESNKLMADVDGHITKTQGVWMKDMVNTVLNRVDRLLNEKEVSGLKTGYTELDRVIGGFEPGELITLGARTSIGKSTLATNIAENISRAGGNVLYLSFEMSPEEITGRVICSQGRVTNTILRNPAQVDQSAWAGLQAGMVKATDMPIMLQEMSSPTVDQVMQSARAFKRKHGIALLVVDHLHLMSHQGQSEVQGIAHTTSRLKGLAIELGVPVLLVAQLNRGSAKENRMPVITDLRGSGAIEQDSNKIFLIHRDQESMPNQALLYIAKNRNGQTGVGITLADSLAYFRFDNAAYGYQEEVY
jgi:replicative DNA helicase